MEKNILIKLSDIRCVKKVCLKLNLYVETRGDEAAVPGTLL